MKAVIIGCGRMGSGLAHVLIQKGYAVTVIDKDPEAFELLGNDFSGKKVVGIGFDKEVMEEAQIPRVDSVIACTSSDETNALIGRIARNIYRVPCVIARLYDPGKAEIYRALGIQTISTTKWGITRALELLSYSQLDSVLTLGNSNVELIRIVIPELLAGRTVYDITAIGEIQVVAVSRNNKTFLPTLGTALQKDDILYISVVDSSVGRLKSLLGMA
jgi:trk system potassium uptake protein TrkA